MPSLMENLGLNSDSSLIHLGDNPIGIRSSTDEPKQTFSVITPATELQSALLDRAKVPPTCKHVTSGRAQHRVIQPQARQYLWTNGFGRIASKQTTFGGKVDGKERPEHLQLKGNRCESGRVTIPNAKPPSKQGWTDNDEVFICSKGYRNLHLVR